MDRELLLEIGCEELPASWLPGLTQSDRRRRRRPAARAPAAAGGAGRNLQHAAAPHRAHRARPRAADRPRRAGQRPAGVGRLQARRHADAGGRRVCRQAGRRGRRARARRRRRKASTSPSGGGSAARPRSTCCPTCSAARCAALTFPEADALGRDARRRPRRAAVRPADSLDAVHSTAAASCRSRSRARRRRRPAQVQDVPSGAVTYGHRFLTTSGRAGRAIKVRSFDEYRARLLENFVILERSERHNKIARELDAKAQRLQGRVSRDRPRRVRPAARGARSRRVPVGRSPARSRSSSSSCRTKC